MRIDVVTIFPPYFDVLDLSLLGKARRNGSLDVEVHDLRDFTHDRHRTVDDTPYGGGPGMLMGPDPWGEALDHVRTVGSADGSARAGDSVDSAEATERPILIVPTPAGVPFTQHDAVSWAREPWLVIACGRYEGIDHRVVQYAERHYRVHEVSLGDYVLNGGEVAALAVIEAVGRLMPGVVGNAESLSEESHAQGTLEAPAFTKPASWRGIDVPEVLLSGHHGEVAQWKRLESLRRTARVRPDLIASLDPGSLSVSDVQFLKSIGWTASNGRFRRADEPVAD